MKQSTESCEMDRAGAIEFLKSKGYSRRISAKLVDIALLEKSDSAFSYALKHALDRSGKGISKAWVGLGGPDFKTSARSTQAKLAVHHEMSQENIASGMDKDAASKKAMQDLQLPEGQKRLKSKIKEIKDKQLHWTRVRQGRIEDVHRH